MKATFVWTAFAVALVLGVATLTWSSATVLRLERAEAAAAAQAALEENARLALWRMDSAVTLLLAQESARPYFQYRAFYPAGGAYESAFNETAGNDLVPSPLLREIPPRVRLHFQLGANGRVTSPQVPDGSARARALLQGAVTADVLRVRAALLAELQAQPPVKVALIQPPPAPRPLPGPRSSVRLSPTPTPTESWTKMTQATKSNREFEVRQQASQEANFAAQMNNQAVLPPKVALAKMAGDVQEGALAPLWLGNRLLLARQVRVNGATYVQGCWLDWARVQQELLESIRDLLPDARLEPATEPEESERRLASLPVRLVPGHPEPAPLTLVSPARLSLLGAWSGLSVAAFAVAALLRGVMALSERRQMFVSAVTHELRTPLTTFRLYTDMLAHDMVASEEKRRQYVGRLQAEAERLGHLVENVLFYARLEGGRGGLRQSVDLGVLLADVTARLGERVAAAGLSITLERPAAEVRVRADPGAIEQILVNLLDNAGKYAKASNPPVVHVELAEADGRARVRVRDHGPGLSAADRRRLFRPFSKSDHEAAATAPGVGLGLALSQRLARAQDGDLRIEDTSAGASFVLTLPLEA
jgi:signal transduction histidine kinase